VPPLRERREDIPLLAERFLVAAAERHRKRIPGIDPAVQELLARFAWPGNVRELQNEIERAAALALHGEVIGLAQVSAKLRALEDRSAAPGATSEERPGATQPAATTSDLRDARTAFEVQFIVKVLGEHNGNVSRAAQALGISRVALQKKMKEYGLR